MKSLAIVGSGIAGLGCAYFLADHYKLTIYEKNDYVGGHSNTIDVPAYADEPRSVAFDTGFMVFNQVTYPLLTKLFDVLSVPIKKTDMSFSVQYLPDRIEWNGAGLNKVFAQRKNLLSLRFWRMLSRLDWFNKNAPLQLDSSAIIHQTVQQYVDEHKLGEDFLNWYLVPMGASVWSTPPDRMLSFPMAALIRFFHNHGFLGLDTHYQWYTVEGGARVYVNEICKKFPNAIKKSKAVRAVERLADTYGARVISEDGEIEQFDKVILAGHADQSLAMLTAPTDLEKQLLTPFKYQDNQITVHSDLSVMPQSRLAWASWNYRVTRNADGHTPTLHYWMNSLQGVSDRADYFVSLNSDQLIDQNKVHKKMQYTHPLFDLATFEAQPQLPALNNVSAEQSIYYCGSYFKNGFHEDAFRSAVDLASTILGERVF